MNALKPPTAQTEALAQQVHMLYMKGNYAGAIDICETIIRSEPDTVSAVMFFIFSYELREHLSYWSGYTYFCKTLLNTMRRPYNKQMVKEYLGKYYAQRGMFEKARTLYATLGIVRQWSVNGGYYYLGGSYDYDHAFPPEHDSGASVCYTTIMGTNYWREIDNTIYHGYLRLNSYFENSDETIYCRSFIHSPDDDEEILIVVESKGPCKVWIDTTPVSDTNQSFYYSEYPACYNVRLSRGVHQILIKCGASAKRSLRVRLLDLNGNPVYWANYASYSNYHTEPVQAVPVYFGVLADILEKANDPTTPLTQLEQYYRAFLFQQTGMINRALHSYYTLINAVPNDHFYTYCYAELLLYNPLCEGSKSRMAMAKNELEFLTSVNTNFALPFALLGDYYYSKGQSDVALTLYQRCGEIDPHSIDYYRRLANYYNDLEWYPELSVLLAEATNTCAQHSSIWIAYGDFYRNVNPEKALYAYAKAYSCNALSGADIKRAWEYAAIGRYTDAERCYTNYLHYFPHDVSACTRLLALYIRYHQYEKSAALLSSMEGFIGKSSLYYMMAANSSFESGQYDTAETFYQAAVQKNPSLSALQHMNYYIKNHTFNAWEQYYAHYTPRRNKSDSVSAHHYPAASGCLLLDSSIIILHPNGTYHSFINQKVKIFNQKGREQWGEITVPRFGDSQLLWAYTVTPDGERYIASEIQTADDGYYHITMPHVIPGATIDYAYEVTGSWRQMGTAEAFYSAAFHGANTDDAYYHSVMQILFPIQLTNQLSVYIHNVGKKAMVKKKRFGNTCSYQIEFNKHNCIIPESSMPTFEEVTPYTYATTITNISVIADYYRHKVSGMEHCDTAVRDEIMAMLSNADIRDSSSIIRHYYYAIQKKINHEGTGFMNYRAAQDTFKQATGSDEDIAILMHAILNMYGIKSYYALVRYNNNHDIPLMQYPSLNNYDGIILYIPRENAHPLWLDFSHQYLSYGQLEWKRQKAQALICKPGGAFITTTEQLYSSIDYVSGAYTISVKPDRSADINAVLQFSGNFGIIRDYFTSETALRNGIQQVANSVFPGIVIEDYNISALNDARSVFTITYSGRKNTYIQKANEGYTAEIIADPVGMVNAYISSEKRSYPLIIAYGYNMKTTYSVTLPDSLHFSEKVSNMTVKHPSGTYSINTKLENNTLSIKTMISIHPYRINPAEYRDFIIYCRGIDEIEQHKYKIKEQQ